MERYESFVGGGKKESQHTETLTSNNITATTLAMATQATHAEGNDGGEADGLEEQHDVEKRNTGDTRVSNGRSDEDHAAGQEAQENDTGLDVVHQDDTQETANGESGLGTGEELRAVVITSPGNGLGDVVDEETRHREKGRMLDT